MGLYNVHGLRGGGGKKNSRGGKKKIGVLHAQNVKIYFPLGNPYLCPC